VRVFSRMRWWCTAEVSSSDGIGARSRSESRSDSTTNRAPLAIAVDTSAKISSQAGLGRAAAPPLTS
jgi:hypothetical protein